MQDRFRHFYAYAHEGTEFVNVHCETVKGGIPWYKRDELKCQRGDYPRVSGWNSRLRSRRNFSFHLTKSHVRWAHSVIRCCAGEWDLFSGI